MVRLLVDVYQAQGEGLHTVSVFLVKTALNNFNSNKRIKTQDLFNFENTSSEMFRNYCMSGKCLLNCLLKIIFRCTSKCIP